MTTPAKQIIRFLLNDERLSLVPMKPALVTSRLVESRTYNDAWQAEESVPRSGWRDWRSAGVQFSSFHKEGTPFALPFRPDSYLWAGPFTLRMPEHDLQI